MDDIRYANRGIIVGIAIAIAGALIFKDSGEVALQASALASFLVGLAAALIPAVRAQRRRERRQ